MTTATDPAVPSQLATPSTHSTLPESDEMELSTVDSATNALANTQDPDDAAPLADGKITQRTYTMVDRIGSDGKVRTYCVWIAVTDDNGKFLSYGNANSPGFNKSVTKLLEVAGKKDAAAAAACDKIFAKGAGQISFNIDRQARDPAHPDSSGITTTITLKNSTSATSLSLTDEVEPEETDDTDTSTPEQEAVTSFMTELVAIRGKKGFLINPKGKPEADPRSLFGGETDDKDAPIGADGKKIPMRTLDKAKDLTVEEQRECLQKMISPDQFPKVALFRNRLSERSLNTKETTTKNLKEDYQKSPVFMPVELNDGRTVYLCLDKANNALYYYDPSTTHEIQSQSNTNKTRFGNSIYEGKSALQKALHDFCNTHGVQNLYAPTTLYKNGSNSHNGLQWFQHLSEQPNLSPENAFPKTKMGDIKIAMTAAEIADADAKAAAARKKKDDLFGDDDDEAVKGVGAAGARNNQHLSSLLGDDDDEAGKGVGAAAPAKPKPVKLPKPPEVTPADAMIALMDQKPSYRDAERTKQWVTALKTNLDKLTPEARNHRIETWKAKKFDGHDQDLLANLEANFSGHQVISAQYLQNRKAWLHYLATSHGKWLLEPIIPAAAEVVPPPGSAPEAPKLDQGVVNSVGSKKKLMSRENYFFHRAQVTSSNS